MGPDRLHFFCPVLTLRAVLFTGFSRPALPLAADRCDRAGRNPLPLAALRKDPRPGPCTGPEMAYPDRPVIALVGDGAMQMNNMGELITVAKYWRNWSSPTWVCMVSG